MTQETDRELLDLAAKAVGLVGKYDTDFDMFMLTDCDVLPTMWNPLTADGDALRLAVALEIDVLQRRSDPEVWAQAPMRPTLCEPIGNDRTAATRRAIVRAAAEIGRTL